MDMLLLSRLQFAMTVGFHFLFPPITIGLGWLILIIESQGLWKKDPDYVRLAMFLAKLLGLTFAVGVASGIVMEFQFGMNWSEYSKFVGDIFGAPLAAEGVFAFFLESTFLGLYLFGRDRVSKGVHWFSALMVAVGSTLSAFWILVANSWQQTPAGYVIRNNRAELTDFWAAVFNPSTAPRFFHTVDAALIAGAFLVAGVGAYLILKNKEAELGKKAVKIAVIFGLIVSLLELFPFGHEAARQVAETQPEKFAALQGLYETKAQAPIALFALPTYPPPRLKAAIEIPGVLSWLTFGNVHTPVTGIDAFSENEIPPLFITFVSYHNMVILGLYFIGLMALAALQLYRRKLWESRKLLTVMVWSIPLPLLACELGWIAAEVGRQPWIVYKLMRTSKGFSMMVPPGDVLFSFILFGFLYLCLGILYIYLLSGLIRRGPEPEKSKEVR